VLHVQDLWPDSVTGSTMVPHRTERILGRTLAGTMRTIYRSAAAVIVIAPSMRDLIIERGADPARVCVVLNWTDESLFHPAPATDEARQALGRRDRCTIMHAGNIGPFQAVSAAIHAAAAVNLTGEVDVVFVGSGIDEGPARRLAADLGTDNVRFVPRQDGRAMAALYGAADFQLVSLRDLPVLRGTIPSKLQAAWSCGSPVLVAAAGDCARLVDDSRTGFSCPPEDRHALAATFRRAAATSTVDRIGMGRRARETYQRQMSMTTGVDRIEEQLLTASAGRRHR
jgi:glycosyltransferase involved in cell wall biosynthesis